MTTLGANQGPIFFVLESGAVPSRRSVKAAGKGHTHTQGAPVDWPRSSNDDIYSQSGAELRAAASDALPSAPVRVGRFH